MAKRIRHSVSLQLSVIMVNYNVRDFLHHALDSLQKALKGIRAEIIVVDNASDDGSVQMVRQRFPSVLLLPNKSNLGFAKANNIALKRARGKYLLLINPDTVVQEDTPKVMLQFFEENPDVGMAGCKILNPDGSFQLACRRSFPTPWVAFTKMAGLGALFPKSRLFGRYNLTYLSPDETYEIDAISGSFMMLRREVYQQVGGLDEEFFMYGEDLDWCFRIQQAGWKIYYVPSTKIIHYKGESTKRSNLNEIRTFYEAMHLFVRKHLNSSWILSGLIRTGIILSSWLAMLKEFLWPLRVAVLDLLLVDLSLMAAEYLYLGSFFYFPRYAYPIVYTIPGIIVVGTLYLSGVYTHRRMSISRAGWAVIISYVIISASVFFAKDFAFSRAVVLISGMMNFLLIPGWRLLVRLFGKVSVDGRRSLFGRRTLIVGADKAGREVLRRLRAKVGEGYDVVGFIDVTRKRVGEQIDAIPIVGSTDNIGKVIQEFRVSDVIFSTQMLSYTDILSVIGKSGEHTVNFHLVPNTLEVIIGKASVDPLDELPLVQISYNIERPTNRLLKRVFDILISTFLLISVYPFVYSKRVLKRSSSSTFVLSLPSVLSGARSLVGPPAGLAQMSSPMARVGLSAQTLHLHSNGSPPSTLYVGKAGLTGLIQLQRGRELLKEEIEQYNLYYAKNQSVILDLEILLRSLLFHFRSPSIQSGLQDDQAGHRTPVQRVSRRRKPSSRPRTEQGESVWRS